MVVEARCPCRGRLLLNGGDGWDGVNALCDSARNDGSIGHEGH